MIRRSSSVIASAALAAGSALMLAYPISHGALAQDQFRPHPNAVLHSFPGAQVYPESVAVDSSTDTFFVGSVKDGTIFKGKLGSGKFEVFSPAGADDRIMATGMFYADNRLVVAGRQTGQIFVYDTQTAASSASSTTASRGLTKPSSTTRPSQPTAAPM
jgi:outer membrane protein assembly factor BamB